MCLDLPWVNRPVHWTVCFRGREKFESILFFCYLKTFTLCCAAKVLLGIKGARGEGGDRGALRGGRPGRSSATFTRPNSGIARIVILRTDQGETYHETIRR